MSLNPELIALLVCPLCKGRLVLLPGGDGLGCPACRVSYPIDDDIPVMIIEEALPWTPDPEAGPRSG